MYFDDKYHFQHIYYFNCCIIVNIQTLKLYFMRKILFSIGGLLIAAVFVISFVNAGYRNDDPKKPTTEVSKDNSKGSCCSAETKQAAENKTASCGKEKSNGADCKTADGKCAHEGCKGAGECTDKESKACCKNGSAAECKSHSEGAK